MLFRPRRTGSAGPWLEWKVRVFVTGAVLGLAGIFLKERGLVWAALGVLAAGLILRWVSERKADEADGEGDDEDEGDEDEEDVLKPS